jgi:DNA-binding Lrp family transcriptional regulator
MTNEERDELKNAVATATKIAERLGRSRAATPVTDVALFALTRAVELLAKDAEERRKLFGQDEFALDTSNVQRTAATRTEPQEASTNPTEAFQDELVERLAEVSWEAYAVLRNDLRWKEFSGNLGDTIKENQRVEARAILAELAKVPVELPTNGELVEIYWQGQKNAGFSACDVLSGAGLGAITGLLHSRLAPALAAKDARIAELGREAREYRESLELSQSTVESQRRQIDMVKEERDAFKARAEAIEQFPGVKEALQRVRERVFSDSLDSFNTTGFFGRIEAINKSGVDRIIDEEIAKVGGQAKTTSVTTACTVCGCPNERAFLDPCVANQKHSFEV